MKSLIKFGNQKLPKSTMIFSMGSYENCPSRKKGLCKVSDDCYAENPETRFPKTVIPFRDRCEEYCLNTSADEIILELDGILSRKRKLPNLFRYNESGDFFTQECVDKLSKVASFLLDKWNILTYGYSAASDLDFSNATFLCKGSGHDKGNNGKTIVIKPSEPTPKGYFRCVGDCHICSVCTTKANIAFPKH